MIVAWIAITLALALVAAGQFGMLRGTPPEDLGLRDGKLKRPSKTPNSVSSQADLWPDHPQRDYARIAPLPVRTDAASEMQRIAQVLERMPRTIIVRREPGYLYAQATTAVLRFTDDIEFAVNAANGVIDVRSASRLGGKDFGVNRARVEAIREALAATPALPHQP